MAVQLNTPVLAQKNPVQVKLVSSVKGTGETEPLTIGLHFKMDEGWKLYAKVPEDETPPPFGQEPEVDWEGSENIEEIEILWPPGEWDGEGFYRVYVYKKAVIIPLKVKLLDESKPLKLKGVVKYFACSTTCRPFEQKVEMILQPTKAIPTPEAEAIEYFEDKAEDFELAQDLEEAASLMFMILMALLGGFILNFMPCVLPVLSLKILGLVKSHHPRYRLKFMATTLGILASFLLLALVIIGLKSVGVSVGWGFHFQEPVFLGFMAGLMIVFALNLYGLFEIPLPGFLANSMSVHTRGLMGDFLSGMFATLLATPCSAPFLGTAVSYALSQGIVEILVLFMALGGGFALPYILGIVLPERFIKLPKPGKWMVYLQSVLATLLLVTGLWLAGILAYQIYYPNGGHEAPVCDNGIEWVPFNEKKIKAYVKEGKTVLVDITAKWCVTCHVNKTVALSDPKVMEILHRDDVITMRGDWTNSNETISNYLHKHKRYGIPFNAIYSAKVKKGLVLPEILTPTDVLNGFKKAGA